MSNFINEFRFALRGLLKHPGFTIIATLTLALGIGANTAIFSVIDAVLLRPLPYQDADGIVMLSEAGEVTSRWISYPNFLDWRDRNKSMEAISTYRGLPLNLTGGGEPETINARMVSADYFRIMRVEPFLGRRFTREEDVHGTPPVTVLSHGFWQRRFGGDANIIGQTIILDERRYTVIGIMPPEFRYQGPPPLWVLTGQWTAIGNDPMQRSVRIAGFVIGRVKEGVTLEQARSDINAVAKQLSEEYPRHNAGHHHVTLVSLHQSITGSARLPLLILAGAVGLVLLIACANVTNLLLARSTSRSREFAVRSALGATRWALIRQLLVESLVLAIIGGIASLLLATWGMELFSTVRHEVVPRMSDVALNYRVLFFSGAVVVLSSLVFGLAPAWQVSSARGLDALKEGGRTSTDARGTRLRNTLVVVEVAVAMVLLVGAGLLIRSLAKLSTLEPGFDPAGVITMEVKLPRQRFSNRTGIAQFHDQLLSRVKALPGIHSAAIANSLPGFSNGWQNDIIPEGHSSNKPGEEISVDWVIASEDYFTTMKIPLVAGRTFTAAESASGAAVVLVDENLARRFWPDGSALGRHLKYDGPTDHEIIGIVRDIRSYDTEAASRIKIYTPNARFPQLRSTLLVRASIDPVRAIKEELRQIDKDVPLSEVATFESLINRQMAPRRFNTILLGIFASIALILAVIGIYGVTAYTVAERTHEIGVRVALGAQNRNVLRMIVFQGMKHVLIGIGLGVLGALALTRVMKTLLFGVSATDPLTYLLFALALMCAALLAAYFPARRATRVDPIIALRAQ